MNIVYYNNPTLKHGNSIVKFAEILSSVIPGLINFQCKFTKNLHDVPDNDRTFVLLHGFANDDTITSVGTVLDSTKYVTCICDYVCEPCASFQHQINKKLKSHVSRIKYLIGNIHDNSDFSYFYFLVLYAELNGYLYTDSIPFSRFRMYAGKPTLARAALLYYLKRILGDKLMYSFNPTKFNLCHQEDPFLFLSKQLKCNTNDIRKIINLSKHHVSVLDDISYHEMIHVFPASLNCDFVVYVETTINDVFISEKTYKLLMSGTPFIVFAAPGFLKRLQSLGFNTFSPFINEVYDSIKDPGDRLTAITDTINSLATSSRYEEIVSSCKAIAQQNQKYMQCDKIKMNIVHQVNTRFGEHFE